MRTEDIPKNAPSDWQPITDKPTLALLGKLAEEANELGCIISRCIIQGIDGRDPETKKMNIVALQEEIADVRGLSALARDRLGLDENIIDDRAQRKYDYKATWIDELERQKKWREAR